MKKLKIGMFIDSYFPLIDGVVMVVDNYAKRMSEYADVVVVTPEIKGKKYNDNFSYRVRRVKSIKIPIAGYSLAAPIFDKGLIKELMNENFDIIHIHSPFTMGKLGIKVAKKMNIPVVATMHTQFKLEFLRYSKSEKISNLLIKNIINVFNKCDKCWAVNDKVASIFFNDYHSSVYPGVLNNGTDLNIVDNPKEAISSIDKKYNINKNDYVFLFVGRINILKNITFIVEVMNYLKKDKMKFKMLFVGSGSDEKILEDKINSYSLQDCIILTGSVTDRELLKQIYYRADLFIFPSLFDASSLVQVEAASQKTPTIFIEGSATSNTIINNRNGYVAPNDPELFALRIKNIMKNKKEYDEVCENSYNEVYKSWDTITKKVYNEYIKIINEKRR